GLPKSVVAHQHHAIDMRLRDREHQRADTTRRERIGRYASRFGIDGMARLERLRQRWSGLGLDAHDPGGASIPGRDPADQTAAAYGHQHGVEGRRLRRKLQAYRPLAQER